MIEEAGGAEGYEFQRLHGMGEVLYEALLAEVPGAACRVYAPVGSHRDLLAYLVRRLLENGANSSFVAAAADPSVPIEDILKRPQAWIGDAAHARHPHIPLPRDLYRPARLNSSGVEFGDRAALNALVDEVKRGGAESKRRPCRRSTQAQRWRRLRRASRPGTRRRSSAAPTFSNAPPNCWRRRAED